MEQNTRLVLFIYINKWIENIFRSVVLPPDVHIIVLGVILCQTLLGHIFNGMSRSLALWLSTRVVTSKIIAVPRWQQGKIVLYVNYKMQLNITTVEKSFFIFLFSEDALNWLKATMKITKHLFQTYVVLLNSLYVKEFFKICMTRSTKTFGSTTVVNTDNNQKCFLSSKSAY